MTEHSLALIRAGARHIAPAPVKNHHLDQIDAARIAKRLSIFPADSSMIDNLLPLAELRMGPLAPKSVILAIMQANGDSVWGIARKSHLDPAAPRAEGFAALLLLSKDGMRALAARTLDCARPDIAFIAKNGERPAGIYFWATYAPSVLAAAVPLIIERLSQGPYDGVPLYTRATTPEGRRFTEALGAQQGCTIDGIDAPHLHVFARKTREPAHAPVYDSYRKGAPRTHLSISVAHSIEDWMQVASVRSAVYLGEQQCPYEEEYDGNDFAAVHLLGYAGDEPAGCIRIRHFADFAKVERLAVRKEFRSTRLSFLLVKAAIELCRVKGYRRIYGHAQRRLLDFWSRFGAIPFHGSKEFVFSDFDYVEVMLEIEPHPDAIRVGTDPFTIIRPEGRWHEPGVLERSAARPPSRPSVGYAT